MNNLFYILCLFVFFSCSEKKKPHQSARAETGQTPAVDRATTTGATAGVPVSKQTGTRHPGTWMYEQKGDKTGTTVYKASLLSTNTLEFGFPYAGGSTATLTIRQRDGNTHVYLEVSKGQFNRSFQGGNARISFDNAPPKTYSFSAAENGRANIIFFDAEKALIQQMKAAKKMIVTVGFYAQGNHQIEFRTDGLSWRH